MDRYLLQDEIMIDDSVNNNPIVGLKKRLDVNTRLQHRLSHLLGTGVRVLHCDGVLEIYILPITGAPQKRRQSSPIRDSTKSLKRFSEDLDKVLTQLMRSETDSSKGEAVDELWDIILLQVYQHSDSVVKAMQSAFIKYHAQFSDLVAQILGLADTDDHISARDTEVGDLVIHLHQLVSTYNGSVAQNNKLIEWAWEVTRSTNSLEERLRQLLPGIFATELSEAIHLLGHSSRTKYTIIRAATEPSVRCVRVRFGNPPKPRSDSASSSSKTSSPKRSSRGQNHNVATPSAVKNTPAGAILAGPTSNGPDRYPDITDLQPMYLQAVAMLIDSVFRYEMVPVGCDAYYLFGFVTCQDQSEERALCGYYRTFLETAQTPIVPLCEKMARALQLGTLNGLLHNKGLQDLKMSHPSLHDFLMVKSTERPTLFRLIQFIRDVDNEKPLPVLKRDYFTLCQQPEHVAMLKKVYDKILNHVRTVRLHDACRFGRLQELAVEVLGPLDYTTCRLLKNEFPHPLIGFDDDRGLKL
ncbi:hypothetical protein E8E13_007177 [Curvularia kusanoi]|uniref:Uncharacterized protein n=1 Tax=Curvularia kusanoi TaxID=90978 RepID=A0A9P4WB31_CURKU|nr:hypothetical protein E8E13_007177 [Curvularia kusanoi]